MQTTLVAFATESPFTQMSDVIDSLKRLERIGDEQSKTVQKILEAARDIEESIGKCFGQASLPYNLKKQVLDQQISPVRYYEIKRGKNSYEIEVSGYGLADPARVSLSRIAALIFAEDIAGGVLDLIEADLQKMQAENTDGLSTLLRAKDSIGPKRDQVKKV